MLKTERIIEFLDIFPYVTPKLISKHVDFELWKKDRNKAYIRAYNHLRQLHKQGRVLEASSESKIFKKIGADRRVGMSYFTHNQAVISVLMNLHLKGYKVEYAGEKNCDGMVEDIALELDRGNHTSNAHILKQVTKYGEVTKVLFVSFPKYAARGSEENKAEQFEDSKKLRKKIASLGLSRKITDKLYFSTYIEASDPAIDPLREKVWKSLNGKNVSVLS